MSDVVTHWDAVEPQVIDRGDLRGRRRRLGLAAGTDRVGLSRYELGSGERPMPLHTHADEEEIVYVLSGSGVTTDGERAWSIAAGDAVVHLAGGAPHTFVAGREGMDVLVFGSGSDTHLTWLPRANAMWAGSHWLPLDGPNPFKAEVEAGPLVLPVPEAERPAHVANAATAPDEPRDIADVRASRHRLGTVAGSRRSGLTLGIVAPDRCSSFPHSHSADEEVFVVLEGDGTFLLHDTDARLVSEHPVRPGSCAARPPGTGVSHAFRAGAGGLTLLAYSRNDPNDMCFYPRSQKISFRGLGVIGRIDQLRYEDGEPSSPGS